MTTKSKILLVDDEPDLVQLIQYNLERAGFQVVTAGDGVEGLRVAELERPDLIVLDIMMPRMDGFAVCRKLRANPRLTHTPILMLTAKMAEEDQVRGLDVGADDYVRKPVSPRLLLSRIRTLLRLPPKSEDGRREQVEENPNSIRVHDLIIDRERFIVIRKKGAQEDRIHLPRKEFELLFYLARHPGKVYSRKDLLDEIWGTDVHVIPRTVDVHVRKIRNRLGPGYIETVTRVGYRFKE